MAVNITPQAKINPLDTDWYDEAETNRQRANANDAALKSAVDALQNAVPVQKIKSGATTYSPDANGLVTLPSGVVAPATTTAERDAIVSPTLGQLIFNTTNARLEVYTASGWKGAASVQVDVFTASGTWTKPAGAALVDVTCFGGGGGGASQNNNGYRGGGGGGRSRAVLLASQVPATVSVTVGAGGQDGPGGTSQFGTLTGATGGEGGVVADNISGVGGAPIGTRRAGPSAVANGYTEGTPEQGGYGHNYNTNNNALGLGGLPSGYGGGGGGGRASSINYGGGASGNLAGGGPGANGASRSGTGLAGSGGGWDGNGGIPAGGAGASSTTTGKVGGRGEVIVVTIF